MLTSDGLRFPLSLLPPSSPPSLSLLPLLFPSPFCEEPVRGEGKGDLPGLQNELGRGLAAKSLPSLWQQVPSCWSSRLLMLTFSPRALKVNLDLTSLLDNEDKKSKNKRGVLPKHATNIMRSWLFQHLMVSVRALGCGGAKCGASPGLPRAWPQREALRLDAISQGQVRGEAPVGPKAGRPSLVLAAAASIKGQHQEGVGQTYSGETRVLGKNTELFVNRVSSVGPGAVLPGPDPSSRRQHAHPALLLRKKMFILCSSGSQSPCHWGSRGVRPFPSAQMRRSTGSRG